MDLFRITHRLTRDLKPLRFGSPVSHVYNPLEYARDCYDEYLRKYGQGTRETVLIGMNPGPWGMAQTGVPFGEVKMVRDWLGICRPVARPGNEHPKRPVEGFDCRRSEVSGARIWGWARERFGTAERFFQRFYVTNYCPLLFLEEGGKNRTPDQLPAAERAPLLDACDRALRATIEVLRPKHVVGVGKFAESRLYAALDGLDVHITSVTHPSPANPQANRGWGPLMDEKMLSLERNGGPRV
ncbi:MAG: single-strand selective monofunctional uracil-DNA glycosylase [Armatimonadetes bacterium]|nr:single-strand selective monofunctional uracil-DNA glycosylase [Armatimonadota bacterium]